MKAPFSWPNSVASSMFSGIAAQLIATYGAVGAHRMIANEARIHFLARAAFAGDQHRGVGVGDLAREAHQRASTRDRRQPARSASTRSGQLTPRHLDQRLGVEGFDDVVGRAFAHRRHRLRDGAVGGHQHHRQIGPQPFDRRQQLVAVRAGHLHVGDHQARSPRSAAA